MYRPRAFREDRIDVLHALIRSHPLATLVTVGPEGLEANLLPFIVATDRGEKGVLRAHLARANDQVASLREAHEAMVIFQGPEAYITPSWYASKSEHGKVVPTWNYVVVLAWGRPHVIDDAEWLRVQIDELTRAQERARPEPWNVTDAPEEFIAGQVLSIIGLEIPIARIEGKWKTSQNRTIADQESVAKGLRAERVSEAMASLVEGVMQNRPSRKSD
jgi:transcriptional regulator